MKPETLREIQRNGWAIETADENTCTAKCPTPGCSMRARFKEGGTIPAREVPFHSWDRAITSFDQAREALKDRRQELGLTIAEVEHISGIAGDHLAKFEKTDFTRPPNIMIFIEWAQSLGFDVVLRHGELPPVTLRWIAETRPKIDARRRRNIIERTRDAELRSPRDQLEQRRAKLERQQAYIANQIAILEDEMRERDQGSLFE